MDMEFDIPTLAVNPNNVKTAINPNNVKTAKNPNNAKTAINPNNVKTAINPNNVKTAINPNNVKTAINPKYLVKTSINPNNVGKTGIDPNSLETKQGMPVKHVRSRAKSHQPPKQQKNKTSADKKLNKSINSFEKEPEGNEEKRPRRSATLSVNYADEFDEQGFRKTGKPSDNPKSIEKVISTNKEIDNLPCRGIKRKSVANKVYENVTVPKVTKTKSAGESLVENESNKRSKRLNSSVNTETILSNPVNPSPMPINAPSSKKPLPRNPTQAKRNSLPAARNSLPAPRNPIPPPDNLSRTAPQRNVPPPIAGNPPSTAKDVPQNKPNAHNARNIGNTLAEPITNALESTMNVYPILGNAPLSAPATCVNSPSTRRKSVAVKRNAIPTPLNFPLNQMNIPLAKSNSYSAQRKLPLPQGSLLTPKNIRLTPQNLSKFKFLQAKKRYGLHPQKASLERGQRSKYKYPRSLEQITEKRVYFWGRKCRNQNYTLIKRQLRNKCDVPNTNKNQVISFTTKNEKEFMKEEGKAKLLTQTITNSSTEVKMNVENPQISKYDQFESIEHYRIFQATKDADLGDNKDNSAIEIEDKTKTIKLDSIKMENKIMTESSPNISEQKTLGKLEEPILSESAKKDFMPLFNNNPDLSWEEAKHKCDECNLKYIVKCHLLAHNLRVHVKKNDLNLSKKNNILDSTSNLNVKGETKDQQKSSPQFENELVSDKGSNEDFLESDGEVGSSEEEGGSEGEDDDMAVDEEAYCENCDVEYDPSSGDHSQCG